MKAAVYEGVGQVRIVDLPVPKPGPNDVLVKVVAASICGTDLSEYHLTNSGAIQPGSEFGHEFAGKVVETGSEVTGISEGMRVTVNPMTATSGGMMNACMVGGFSQYVLVEDAAVGYNIYPLPERLSYDDGALTEPFSVGMGGVNTAETQTTDRALILGAGPIGMGALAGMKALGVENVVVSDISEFRLQKARELGADAVHNPRKVPLEEFLKEWYGESSSDWGLVDVVVDAAGSKPALESALDVVRYGARVSVVALHKVPISFHPMIFFTKNLAFRGSVGYTREFEQVLGFMASGKADLKPIVTHRFPLDEIESALRTATKTDEAIKMLIDMPD